MLISIILLNHTIIFLTLPTNIIKFLTNILYVHNVSYTIEY